MASQLGYLALQLLCGATLLAITLAAVARRRKLRTGSPVRLLSDPPCP